MSRQASMTEHDLDAWFDRRFAEKMQEHEARRTPSMAIIATKGTLDMAYPPFILASTGAALGWDVPIFCTFYGLSLLKKDLDLKVTPVGNPAMPMKMPEGPDWLTGKNLKIPNSLMALTPGFQELATSMMRKTFEKKGVASIEQLREISIESGVRMVACQMTVDLFDWKPEDFIPDIDDWVGAASFLPFAQKADVSLFI